MTVLQYSIPVVTFIPANVDATDTIVHNSPHIQTIFYLRYPFCQYVILLLYLRVFTYDFVASVALNVEYTLSSHVDSCCTQYAVSI